MVNHLINAIAIKLNAVFGDEFKVYKNDVQQGLKRPCFFISALKFTCKPRMGGRCFQINPFDVHYFPAEGGDNDEMLAVAQRLMDALEMITMQNGDLIRGTNRSYEIVDGVLHFFVHFNMHLIKAVDETPMETLEVETGTMKG